MTTIKPPKPGLVAQAALEQEQDLATLQTIGARLARRLTELNDPKWSEKGRAAEIALARAPVAAQAEKLLAVMEARAAEARTAVASWDPPSRRFQAALEKPLEAQALLARLQRATPDQLEAVATSAVEGDDFLLQDVVAQTVASWKGELPAARRISEALEGAGGADREAIQASAARILEAHATGAVVAGELVGHPLSVTQKMTLAHAASNVAAPVGAA